ncbi:MULTISPECIES: hypothetical protein [unclassified Halomonas]|uniref:hypothetical protein n=1 Tax=unclassified Halomonas TaxID=2609666 RepID=UPI002884809E|nr:MULTISPECIES: hypothetical protein [unclassified Halomonas]MDT0499675.1 hypothetical protein [Halomonas sp. PAR7]MDT0510508.1 hypothetical protein [Halomonas sp. LES1]MDT0592693.1 hypothetical protein [Halomonas sp. PAR8]
MSPERNVKEFTVFNSFNVEKLTETLNARAERLCTFLLILLGSAVFGNLANTFLLGFAVASIAALQFVCRFGEAAGAAKAQKQRYAALLGRMDELSDKSLIEQMERVHEQDSRALSAVELIAYNKACLMRGQPEQMKALTLSARLLAPLIGGQPCEPAAATQRGQGTPS